MSRDRRHYRGNNASRNHESKKEKTTIPESELTEISREFLTYQKLLDEKHDRYERLVKLSRDITIESKRAIFTMQRVTGKTERDLKSLSEAEEKFDLIHREKFYLVASELHGQDPYQYIRAYSPGIQEYIEALSFHRYLTSGELISMEDVLKNLHFQKQTEDGESLTISVHLSPVDYILGVADLTGELMRVAVNSVGQGDFQKPFEICKFLQKIHSAFIAFGKVNRHLPGKVNVLKTNLTKVENVCYTIQIRGSEFPEHILADMIKNSAASGSNNYDEDLGFCAD